MAARLQLVAVVTMDDKSGWIAPVLLGDQLAVTNELLWIVLVFTSGLVLLFAMVMLMLGS
jgi:hypothetical protein